MTEGNLAIEIVKITLQNDLEIAPQKTEGFCQILQEKARNVPLRKRKITLGVDFRDLGGPCPTR